MFIYICIYTYTYNYRLQDAATILRILLSGWHLGAILVFLRSSPRVEQIAGAAMAPETADFSWAKWWHFRFLKLLKWEIMGISCRWALWKLWNYGDTPSCPSAVWVDLFTGMKPLLRLIQ